MNDVTVTNNVVAQINSLISWLIQNGLSDDQNPPFSRELPDGSFEVVFNGSQYVSDAMKNRPYSDIYDRFTAERVYNIKMPDGALIQMMYHIRNDEIIRHRLAMFPSPHLDVFQNEPDLYLEDDIFADVVARNVLPVPIRFDYDGRDESARDLDHPKSHLTLGQYEHCRIPVSSALTPFWFVHFILRNFYNTAFSKYSVSIPTFALSFTECITESESNVVHIAVPSSSS